MSLNEVVVLSVLALFLAVVWWAAFIRVLYDWVYREVA